MCNVDSGFDYWFTYVEGVVTLTEKRFAEIVSVEKVIDNETGKEYKCIIDTELLELLNELYEENQTLKQENKELQFAYDECSNNKLFSRRKLETENKNLKDENIRLSKDKQLAETEIIRIRQTLNDAIETERTNIGQSVLKQFKEAITE